MDKLNKILQDLDLSKVKLSKYLGVSRQMVYNYLEGNLEKMPNDKKLKLFDLLGIEDLKDLNKIKVDADYIMEIETKLNHNNKKVSSNSDNDFDIKGLKKADSEVLTNIFLFIKEKLLDDKTNESNDTFNYLYDFLRSMDNAKELKYILGYVSKSTGFTDPNKFVFNEEQQFVFEGIMYSAMTLYTNGGASRSKIAESHKRWENEIEQKKEEKLSRTQQLNSAKVQALKELGYDGINEENAAEVLAKIAEIESRNVA